MADQELLPPSQLVPLDFSSIQTVPESHVWLDLDEQSSAIRLDEKLSLPLIDLLDDGASELLGKACEQWGMFQLINHGVPQTLIAETEEEARRLFTLPARDKMKTLQSPDSVTGYGMAVISKYYSKYMWHEGFTILGSPVDDAKKLWPSNFKRFWDQNVIGAMFWWLWIERNAQIFNDDHKHKMAHHLWEDIWSLAPSWCSKDNSFKHYNTSHISLNWKAFCEVMEEYQTKMKGLADMLLRLTFKFLDISEEEITKVLSSIDNSGKPNTALRLNSYPPCPDPDRVMGLAAHTDTSLFTIVHQARKDGLQIFNDGVGWVPLSPMSGSLIVNVGDLLHIISNGRFPSILHRVMIQGKTEHRFSLAYFYSPPADLYISPYCKPLSESPQIPLYRSVTVKEYSTMKAKNNADGLSTIKM